MQRYKIWCGTTDHGYADNTVNLEAENLEDAIKQSLEYLNDLDKELDPEYRAPEGVEWVCYEYQDRTGWYKRETPNGEFVQQESYLDEEDD